MGPLAAAASVVSAGMSILGGFQQASAAKSAAAAQQQELDYRAAIGRQQAGQAIATGQRQAIVSNMKTDLVVSNARAAAAASGSTTGDPDVVGTIGDIRRAGNYDALSQIYTATERANALKTGAQLDTFQGDQARIAGDVAASGLITRGIGSAVGTIAGSKGIQSLYDKYAAGWGAGTTLLPN